ncbi:MAG TPA: DUF6152 family protein [Candidatus Acidoferrales bacterium]|jgi:hypothetical protein|nr:DUF6152 family protein [Candidatus Acidoferrales bacterium]
MRIRLAAVIAAVLVLMLAGSVFAHHATASYNMTQSSTVKGTVTNFEWTNPHAYIYLDVKDAKGTTEKWTVELGTIGMLSRAGWKRDTVKPGDEITATGNPAKDGRPLMRFEKLVFANGRELTSEVQ